MTRALVLLNSRTIQALASLSNKTAGRTRFGIFVNFLFTIREDKPARSAARLNRDGESLLLTNGRPATRDSGLCGLFKILASSVKQDNNGSSCVR